MNTKKIIYLFSLLLVMGGVSSCKKLLEIKETDAIAGEAALGTVTFVEQSVIGAYAGLGVEMSILLNSTFSDELATAGEFYNAATTHEWQYGNTDVGIRDNFTAINPNYTIINRANTALAALPGADSTKVGDEVKRRILRGEALFLRAYAHFELFRYYCSNYDADGLAMPYMETSTIVPQARIKMGPYFQKLNADLTEAKGLLPNNLTDLNRATVAAANALHARVALYQRDWVNAETYASAVINAVPLASRTNFPGIWTDANTNEVVMRLIRTTLVGGRIGSLFRGTSANTSNIGVVTWRPSNKLWDSYDQANDVRFTSYLRDEPLLTAASRQSRLVYKYWGTGIATTNENVNNGKVFRVAEMYLIRAEARAEQNKVSGANSAEGDLNTLRAARINGYTNETFSNKDAVITAIITERFKELAFEGHRFFDLKRRGLPVQRLLTDVPNAGAATLSANNFRFLLPIPQVEMLANPLMVQNAGYQ
jgi:starch-binding outer membrane protein, SusD/RagB family